MTRALILAAALVMAGCTTERSTVTTSTSPATGGVFPFVRTCDSAVFGQPNMRDSVRIGPLTLVGTAQALSPSTFEPHQGRYAAIKVLALVTGPDDVTVTVPLSERDSLFLLYDPGARGNRHGFLVAAGDAQVRFEACGEIEPQYNGVFLATEPGCAQLEVSSEGSGLTRGWINLGGRSPCRNERGFVRGDAS
jgi:hypothetical protein